MSAVTKPIAYAKAGATPGWERMIVFDREAGDIVTRVIEVNVREGWLVRYKTDEKNNILYDPCTGQVRYERRRGRFVILCRPKGRADV